MPVHKVMPPACKIRHSDFVNVNSHVVVKRGKDLLEMHRPVVGFAAQAVGGTNHLSGLHAARTAAIMWLEGSCGWLSGPMRRPVAGSVNPACTPCNSFESEKLFPNWRLLLREQSFHQFALPADGEIFKAFEPIARR